MKRKFPFNRNFYDRTRSGKWSLHAKVGPNPLAMNTRPQRGGTKNEKKANKKSLSTQVRTPNARTPEAKKSSEEGNQNTTETHAETETQTSSKFKNQK
jgi:hypothetical protein